MITQHYPRVSMEFSGSRGRASDRDLEQQRRKKEWYRKHRANMTPEQLDAERAHQLEYYRKRRASMTPKELDAMRAHQREYVHKRRANMTPEQLEALRAYRRQYSRKRRWKARVAKATLEN